MTERKKIREGGVVAAPPCRFDHVLVPNPAAGAGAVVALDSRYWNRVMSVLAQLDTSAAVANRVACVDYCDPEGTTWVRNFQDAGLAAGLTNAQLAWAYRGAGGVNPDPAISGAGMSGLWIPPGWQLQVNVVHMDAADQLHSIRVYVEQYSSDLLPD